MTDTVQILTKAYTEPHRRYHTLEHIAHMFNVARDHNIQLSNTQIEAIWWHDAVYVPGAKDNEVKSAELMLAHTTLEFARHREDAAYIILETATHVPATESSAVVCDLDMFGFVDSIEKHTNINKQIKAEFALAGVTADVYRDGRLQFLKSLVDKQMFYSTYFVKYNDLAQSRIAADIMCIEHG